MLSVITYQELAPPRGDMMRAAIREPPGRNCRRLAYRRIVLPRQAPIFCAGGFDLPVRPDCNSERELQHNVTCMGCHGPRLILARSFQNARRLLNRPA